MLVIPSKRLIPWTDWDTQVDHIENGFRRPLDQLLDFLVRHDTPIEQPQYNTHRRQQSSCSQAVFNSAIDFSFSVNGQHDRLTDRLTPYL